jgi:hypothetical protein
MFTDNEAIYWAKEPHWYLLSERNYHLNENEYMNENETLQTNIAIT